MRLLRGGEFREPWQRSAEPDRRRKEYLTWAVDPVDKRAQMAGRGGKLRSSSSCPDAATEHIPDRPDLHRVRAGATVRNDPPDRHSTDGRCWPVSAAFFFQPG